jgi:WD40 repeat protein
LPNGDLASGASDRTIKIWDVDSGTVKKNLTGHTGQVNSLDILLNGDLVSGADDGSVLIWNLTTGLVKKNLTAGFSSIRSIAVLPDGTIASGFGKTIKIWDVDSESVKQTLSGHASTIISIKVLDNESFASAAIDTKIKIWKLEIVTSNTQPSVNVTTISTTTEPLVIEVTLQPPSYINARK